MNMSKLRTKHNRYRCLKTISYLLGFPLLIVLVLVGSMTLFRSDAFDAVKWNGVIVCLALWLVSVVIQMVISLITKNYNARTLVMVLVSLILVTGGAVAFDMLGEKQFEKAVDEYKVQAAEHGVFDFEIEDFKHHTGFFDTWTKGKKSTTDTYIEMLNKFTYAYNVKYKSKNYGKVNGDGSKITYNKEDDAWYSENGLYADGYRFGVKQALQVLIDYNEAKFAVENEIKEVEEKDSDGNVIVTKKIVSTNKKVDVELQKALDALDTNSEWLAYKRSEEYVAAYGKDGSAYNNMLNEERLNKIVQALGKKLNAVVSVNATLKELLDGVLAGFGLSMDDLGKLDVDKIVDLLNGLKLFPEPLEKADLLKLLEDFSFYQVPSVKPKFAFIKDETLKKYAYANYYATVHGANVASVLVGDFIGQVTMDNKGHIGDTYKENNIIYKRDEDGNIVYDINKDTNKPDFTKPIILYSYDGIVYSFSLPQLYQLKARTELYTKFYPLMAARRYAYTATGFIALGFVLFYYYKRKEDEAFGLFANTGMGGKF